MGVRQSICGFKTITNSKTRGYIEVSVKKRKLDDRSNGLGATKRESHALALDEHREAFSPTLYDLPECGPITDARISEHEQKILEAHSKYHNISNPSTTARREAKAAAKPRCNEPRKELIWMQELQKEQFELLPSVVSWRAHQQWRRFRPHL